MKKMITIFLGVLFLMSANDAMASDFITQLQTLRARETALESQIKTAKGADKLGLQNQLSLLRGEMLRVSQKIYYAQWIKCRKSGKVSWCRQEKTTESVTATGEVAKIIAISSKSSDKIKIVQQGKKAYIHIPNFSTVKDVKHFCPKDGKVKVSFDPKSGILQVGLCQPIRKLHVYCSRKKTAKSEYIQKTGELRLVICSGRDGQAGKAGKVSNFQYKGLKVQMLPPGSKPKGKVKDGVLYLEIPSAKDGKDGERGADGLTLTKREVVYGQLPNWLKWHVGFSYLLTHGPRERYYTRHNLMGVTGLAFVLHPRWLNLYVEGGIGYETVYQLLSLSMRGGFDINAYRSKKFSLGVPIGIYGNWNLNRSNLAEYELVGASVGVRVNVLKHLRLGIDAVLGQRRWTTNQGLRRRIGGGGIFTVGFQL